MDKQQKLLAIIDLLKASPTVSVTITSAGNGQELCKHMTAAEMEAQYGSVEDFFNALVSKGFYEMVVITRRRNGSSWINHPQMGIQVIEVERPQPVQEQPANAPAPVQQLQVAAPPMFMGLGAADPTGMMAGLQGQMIYHHMDYPKVLAENVSLKAENKDLTKEVAGLKEELLKKDFSDAKANGNKEMLNSFVPVLQTLLPVLLAGKNGGALPAGGTEGLAGAGITPEKQEAIQTVIEFPDTYMTAVNALLAGFADNSEFQNEAVELMKKHNLIT